MNGQAVGEFRFALVDDAMAPDWPRGMHLIFDTVRRARPGRVVLVKTADGQLHVRTYAQGRTPGHWTAEPSQRAYTRFDSQADGLEIVAVMRGSYDPSDD